MMFPKDRTLYANLNTSFTSFDALIADLKERKLTGYIEITAPAYTGTLLLSEGEVVNAQELSGDKRTVGPEAARGVMERAAQKDGVINVYSAFPDVVLLLHRLMDSRPLYRDLTSAFTSLDRLISKLRSDGLTGYVEVHIGENEGAGIIYLAGGEPVESVFSSGGQMTNGQEALNAIVSTVNTSGGTFNVFVEAGDGSAAGEAPGGLPVRVTGVLGRRYLYHRIDRRRLREAGPVPHGVPGSTGFPSCHLPVPGSVRCGVLLRGRAYLLRSSAAR